MAGLKVKIDGIPGLDGLYEMGERPFTNGELHILKKDFDLRIGEIKSAVRTLDNDLLVGYAYIALRRNGKLSDPDPLWEAEAGTITVIDPAKEAAASPPAEEPPSTANGGGSNDGKQISGEDSDATLESPERTLSATGMPGLEAGAI